MVGIICSAGWIGAAAAYLALGLAAQLSQRGQLVQAAWIAMGLTGWYVIVPLGCWCSASSLDLISTNRGAHRVRPTGTVSAAAAAATPGKFTYTLRKPRAASSR